MGQAITLRGDRILRLARGFLLVRPAADIGGPVEREVKRESIHRGGLGGRADRPHGWQERPELVVLVATLRLDRWRRLLPVASRSKCVRNSNILQSRREELRAVEA
jgi:hypothetical protein